MKEVGGGRVGTCKCHTVFLWKEGGDTERGKKGGGRERGREGGREGGRERGREGGRGEGETVCGCTCALQP